MDKRLICLLLITFSLPINARLPGWHGVDHIGIAVPDYDQAVDFLVNVIGCEQLVYDGPYSDPTGDWMQKQFEIEPRAILKKMGMLRCNFGSNIELFEWSAADQRKQIPRLSDIGANHIAFYVDDLDAAIDYLKSHGVEVLHEPLRSTTGDMAGDNIIYFKTPWGAYMELVSSPNGKGYEKNTERRLWHPARPGQ